MIISQTKTNPLHEIIYYRINMEYIYIYEDAIALYIGQQWA